MVTCAALGAQHGACGCYSNRKSYAAKGASGKLLAARLSFHQCALWCGALPRPFHAGFLAPQGLHALRTGLFPRCGKGLLPSHSCSEWSCLVICTSPKLRRRVSASLAQQRASLVAFRTWQARHIACAWAASSARQPHCSWHPSSLDKVGFVVRVCALRCWLVYAVVVFGTCTKLCFVMCSVCDGAACPTVHAWELL